MDSSAPDSMFKHIPPGIRTVTLVRSIRWIGWGFCETLIPVLLFSFSHTYAEAGLLRSIYDIVFLLALPAIGILADRVPAKYILLFALALYPLIGISYFLAGAIGAVFPIVLARAINGVAWCADSIGGSTYLRRYAPKLHLSSAFGYLESLPNIFWMLAALASVFLIPRVPLHYLFLAVVPTSLISLWLLKRLPVDSVPLPKIASISHGVSILSDIKGIFNLRIETFALIFFAVVLGVVDVIGSFFLPLYSYEQGASLSQVVFISVVFAVPSAFAFWFGKVVDCCNKKTVLAVSFLLVAVLLYTLSFTDGFMWQMLGMLALGCVGIFAHLALEYLATEAVEASHYGRIGGWLAGADAIGSIAGPIAIGFFADSAGMSNAFVALAVLVSVTALGIFLFRTSPLRSKFK